MKVIFAWPLIILALVLSLRKSLIALLQRDLEAEAGGVKVRVGRAEEAAGEALEEATTQFSSSEIQPEFHPENSPSDQSPRTGRASEGNQSGLVGRIAELEKLLTAEETRRASLERVLSEGAQIGWEWARAGQKEPPEISVNWSAEGAPRVSAVPQKKGLQTMADVHRSARIYERLLWANLELSHPRLSAISAQTDVSGVEGDVRIVGPGFDLHIGVIIKYTAHGGPMPIKLLEELVDTSTLMHAPVLLVTNYNILKAADEFMRDFNSSGTVRAYMVHWKNDSDNDNLRTIINRIVNDYLRDRERSREGLTQTGDVSAVEQPPYSE
ncbi:hypothetical protein [Microbispora triticiradicis]|uniref:Restriction endonuclease type IV Mrr domain-containing protein n=2 Tax=Microbispora TaxID=2005 RepID=A0ABY3M6C3_9ACTN|nr:MULTISPECIES: hypothetical protein [Microbispora]TLP66461.1 hypothetical protein FED44_03045 [Microbispora fusca]TYB68245.1 hypothetical protein FXF59_01785 [Microbispora tritici]